MYAMIRAKKTGRRRYKITVIAVKSSENMLLELPRFRNKKKVAKKVGRLYVELRRKGYSVNYYQLCSAIASCDSEFPELFL